MKAINLPKYFVYVLLFLVFLVIRCIFLVNENGIYPIELKSLGVASAFFPFGIIKESAIADCFLPFYYFLIHFFAKPFISPVVIKILNLVISFLNVILIVETGKKLLNKKLGYLLAVLLIINHFYLFYSNLIAPYCLVFLFGTYLINSIIDFITKQDRDNLGHLLLANILFIVSSNVGFIYVIAEFIVFYFVFIRKKKSFSKTLIRIGIFSFYAFLSVFFILIIQYFNWTKMLIPETNSGVGLNLNSLYLMINEYISPYLSFDVPQSQTKTTLGMLYSLFVNFNLKNFNTIKIIITLFYSSILPLIAIGTLLCMSYKKNIKLKIIFQIALINFLIVLFFMLFEIIDVNPIYIPQLFFTIIIMFGYGIYLIKDYYIKTIIIFCFIAIQFINPEINIYNISINKNYPTVNIFKKLIKEKKITENDKIIMPYMENYAKNYYKKLNFFDFDYSYLKKDNKDSFIRNLANKNTQSVNRRNLNFMMNDYLSERLINKYISNYFIKNIANENSMSESIVLFVDKSNSRPITKSAILKSLNIEKYNTKLRKISFKTPIISSSKCKFLYDAIKAKTLYNIVALLNDNYYISEVLEYKLIDNEYFKIDSEFRNIDNILISHRSDYVFIFFKTYR